MKFLILIHFFIFTNLTWAQMPNSNSMGKQPAFGVIPGLPQNDFPEEYSETLEILKSTPGYPVEHADYIFSFVEESGPKMIESYDSGIRGLIANIPNSQLRTGLEKYLEIINAEAYKTDSDVGGSNRGLGQYHQATLASNPCFATLAENFYSEVLDMTVDTPSDHPLNGRPTLGEESGSGRFEDLEPGWLMEKALEATNGDANLAIEMIGLCGHDDVSQYGSSLDNFSYPSRLNEEGSNLDLIKQTLAFQINRELQNLQLIRDTFSPTAATTRAIALKEELIAKLREFEAGVSNGSIQIEPSARRNIRCPRNNSPFYVAKALGEEVDLSEEQKRRVEVIQAPTKGRGYLPAKNYHFMGAAYMACKLVQEGVSPGTAILVQKTAAWAYRTIRMNTKIRTDLEVIDELDEMYETFVENFHQTHFIIEKTRRGDRRKRMTPPTFDQWMYKQVVSQRERALGLLFDNQSPTEESLETESTESADSSDMIPILENFPEGIRGLPRIGLELKDIAEWRVQFDAAKILDGMSIGGGSVAGYEIPHTNLGLIINYLNDPISRKVTMVDLENDPNRTTPIKPRRSRGYPHNWSKDRYQKAHDKALTYLIDWEWTGNQHEIGADFGANQCTRQEPDAKPDDLACSVLGERPDVVCNLIANDKESAEPINTKLGIMGQISDQMTKKYLDSGISTNSSNGVFTIQGAF